MTSAALLAGLAAHVREGHPNVPSPCVAVCRMSPDTSQCLGCLRTLDEIAVWSRLDDDGKRIVWQRIEQRLALTTP